jgi:hypothetical protein
VSTELTCVFNVNGMTAGEKYPTYPADVFQCEYNAFKQQTTGNDKWIEIGT